MPILNMYINQVFENLNVNLYLSIFSNKYLNTKILQNNLNIFYY